MSYLVKSFLSMNHLCTGDNCGICLIVTMIEIMFCILIPFIVISLITRLLCIVFYITFNKTNLYINVKKLVCNLKEYNLVDYHSLYNQKVMFLE